MPAYLAKIEFCGVNEMWSCTAKNAKAAKAFISSRSNGYVHWVERVLPGVKRHYKF